MYELFSETIAEPRLRPIRQRALPSMQRRRLQERELHLLRAGYLIDDGIAPPPAPRASLSARAAAAIRRWVVPLPQTAGRG